MTLIGLLAISAAIWFGLCRIAGAIRYEPDIQPETRVVRAVESKREAEPARAVSTPDVDAQAARVADEAFDALTGGAL